MKLREYEEQVDELCGGITEYVIKITKLQISQKEHEFLARLLQVLSDMERISDYCENISEYAETLAEKKLAFSEVGEAGLREMLTTCANSYYYAIEAFMEEDIEKAEKVIELECKADELEVSLRTKHIKRLSNQECNTESGIVFLDTLVGMERISDHARNIAEEVLEHVNC